MLGSAQRPRLIFGFLDGCPFCEAARPAVEQVRGAVRGLDVVAINATQGEAYPVPETKFPAFALLNAHGEVVASTNAARLPSPITAEALAGWVYRAAQRYHTSKTPRWRR